MKVQALLTRLLRRLGQLPKLPSCWAPRRARQLQARRLRRRSQASVQTSARCTRPPRPSRQIHQPLSRLHLPSPAQVSRPTFWQLHVQVHTAHAWRSGPRPSVWLCAYLQVQACCSLKAHMQGHLRQHRSPQLRMRTRLHCRWEMSCYCLLELLLRMRLAPRQQLVASLPALHTSCSVINPVGQPSHLLGSCTACSWAAVMLPWCAGCSGGAERTRCCNQQWCGCHRESRPVSPGERADVSVL